MKFTCGKCHKEIEVEKLSAYNQMALQDGWCESCWYYEHWRPYKLWIGEKGFGVHGWAEITPPDYVTIYYEQITEPNYEKRDWRGNHTWNITPERHDTDYLMSNEKAVAKRLSEEYKTTVLICGQRPEEKDTVFGIAFNGKLFKPVEETDDKD